MKFENILSTIIAIFLIAGCSSREEEQSDFEKTMHNLRARLDFVMAIRQASSETGVDEEILYGIVVVEGGRPYTYIDLTYPRRVGRLGLFHYPENDIQGNSNFPLNRIFLAAAKDLKYSYEVTGNWDLALLSWGSDDQAQVLLCLSDFSSGDLEQYIVDHSNRWRYAPCFESSLYWNFELGLVRTLARRYSVNNIRHLGAYVKSRIDINYPRFDSPVELDTTLPPLIITLECPNATASVLREGLLRAGCSGDGNPFANDVSGESVCFPELPPE